MSKGSPPETRFQSLMQASEGAANVLVLERISLAVALASGRRADAPASAMLKVEGMPFKVGDNLCETDAPLETSQCHSTNLTSSMSMSATVISHLPEPTGRLLQQLRAVPVVVKVYPSQNCVKV
jgi:hypothetical protein